MDPSSHKSVNEPDDRDPTPQLDDWLDAALEQSFPASDPLPSFRGALNPPFSATGESGDTP